MYKLPYKEVLNTVCNFVIHFDSDDRRIVMIRGREFKPFPSLFLLSFKKMLSVPISGPCPPNEILDPPLFKNCIKMIYLASKFNHIMVVR